MFRCLPTDPMTTGTAFTANRTGSDNQVGNLMLSIANPQGQPRPITPAGPPPAAATYLSSEVSHITTSMTQKKYRTKGLTRLRCMLRWGCQVGNGLTPDRTPAGNWVKTEGDSQPNTKLAPIHGGAIKTRSTARPPLAAAARPIRPHRLLPGCPRRLGNEDNQGIAERSED